MPSKENFWSQPPGHVMRMLSANYLPRLVRCDVTGKGAPLDANAKRAEDGKTLALVVVNPGDKTATAQIKLSGFTPTQPTARVTELSGPLDAVNTADKPDAIAPRQTQWRHALKDELTSYAFPPHSLTVIRFE